MLNGLKELLEARLREQQPAAAGQAQPTVKIKIKIVPNAPLQAVPVAAAPVAPNAQIQALQQEMANLKQLLEARTKQLNAANEDRAKLRQENTELTDTKAALRETIAILRSKLPAVNSQEEQASAENSSSDPSKSPKSSRAKI